MQQNEHLNRAVEIDYQLLAIAQTYYKNLNYEYVDLPWATPKEINNITFADSRGQLKCIDNFIWVGSAEQSFIWWAKQQKLNKNIHYQSITPCFRNEQRYNEYYYMYFVKLELFSQTLNVEKMLNDSLLFFQKHISKECKIEKTDIGYDIIKDGIELGSYGRREHDGLIWTYGTGLALPRATLIKNK